MSPNTNSSSSSSTSRWCPTPEQLMILEEMYRAGTRTPNASQIQQITAHLSFYGKIEGKNVFYWFQNHKARDRQKLRRKIYKQLQQQHHHHFFHHQQHQQLINHHQNHHHHFLNAFSQSPPTSSPTFQQLVCFNSPAVSHIAQVGVEEASQLMNYTWKMEIAERIEMEKTMMRMYGRDWMMMMDVGPPPSSSPCCSSGNSRPLKTLQLFPVTATNLKEEEEEEECTTMSSNKHLPT